MISDLISDEIPLQLKILNIFIPILMLFLSLVSNLIIAGIVKPHLIQQNVV